MKNSWIIKGNEWWITDPPSSDKLNNSIYVIKHKEISGFYLLEKEEEFNFSYKIYDLENNFIDRIIKSYKTFDSNMGILLYGIKGTGKSVTAKTVCNKLNLPVILIENDVKDLTGVEEFINNIPQEFIVFIDEYEKKYGHNDDAMLSVMDGSASSKHKRLFIFTTNSIYINDNLLSRPSRIRYIKKYGSLESSIIDEIIKDTLLYQDKKEDIVNFCNTLNIVTVDILKAIISEVNLFNESPQSFEDVFNVSKSINRYDVYEIDEQNNFELLYKDVSSNIEDVIYSFFSAEYDHEKTLQINKFNIGIIIKAINKDTITILISIDEEDKKNPIVAKILKNKSEYKTLKFIKK